MISVLHYGLSANRGGIETYLDKLWSNIDRTEFHFDFVDEWYGKTVFRKKFEESGAEFYDIAPRRASIVQNRKQWNALLSEHRPDILHCHLNTLSYVYPVRAALKRGIPVIVHSRNSGTYSSVITKLLHYKNKHWLRGKGVKRVAISTEAGIWLFGKEAEVTVINNSVDIERFAFSEPKREELRAAVGARPDTKVIGTCGNLSEQKNPAFLLDVFSALHANDPNSLLIIAGEGELREQIEDKIKTLSLVDSVRLLGSRDDVDALLSAMDVFVMPSRWEGFGNAALEAQANGLPCLLSDVFTREVDAGLCRFLPLEKGPKRWAEEMGAASTKKDRGQPAPRIGDFSVETERQKIEELYRRVAGCT